MSKEQSRIGRLSRRKGKAFECLMARYFTKVTGEKWSSTRNSGRTDLKGDIYNTECPDLNLVVECKHDKNYSVHAMLLPTKAFSNMIDEVKNKCPKNHWLMIIIKNDTGIWMSLLQRSSGITGQGIITKGLRFCVLNVSNLLASIDGV